MYSYALLSVFSLVVLYYLWFAYKRSKSTPIQLYFCTANQNEQSGENLIVNQLKKCPSLLSSNWKTLSSGAKISNATYVPSFFLLNRHVHTLWGGFVRRSPHLECKRDILYMDDGGTLSVDWFVGDFQPTTKTIIILHGLTGGSHETYVQNFAQYAMKHGFRTVVTNYRGCAKTPLTSSRYYCASNTEDVTAMINHIQKTIPAAPLFAIGFSLGSILLTKYVATTENHPIIAGVGISNPMNLIATVDELDASWFSDIIYNRGLSRNLIRGVDQSAHHWPEWQKSFNFDNVRVKKIKTVRNFDVHFTSKMWGYEAVEDYYNDAMSANFVDKVKLPMLYVNSLDDPLAPAVGIPFEKFLKNEHTVLATTNWGGHVAFLEGWGLTNPSWSDRAAVEWFSAFHQYFEDLKSAVKTKSH